MINLKLVCISDLHLGAPYSILTDVGAGEPPAPSATLKTFAAATNALLQTLLAGSSTKAQLVLLGDILDLGMSPVSTTATAYQGFIEALFPNGTIPCLSNDILYVPGNHDHNVWRWSEDDRYVQQLDRQGSLDRLEPVTRLFPIAGKPGELVQSNLLTKLTRATSRNPAATVRLAYPNYAVAGPTGRCVVFHHGHYIESTYRMMTDLRRLLALGGPPVTNIAELEKENSAWIDFFWSTFGEGGLVGEDVDSLYLRLQDGASTEQLIHRLSRRLVRHFQNLLPMSGEHQVQLWARRAASALLDLVVQRTGEIERNSFESVLTQESVQGLTWYLDGPVAQQFRDEDRTLPDDAVFVFGHTHKPFEDALTLSAYRQPVRVFNTGGWVLDEPGMASLEGASMVLVDDDLNVVSVRLFNQNANGDPREVHVPDSGASPPDSTLHKAVKAALSAPGWAAFTKAAGAALRERQSSVIRRYDLSKKRNAPALRRAAR